ncbi:hypothetical protein CQW23_21316 [Capsicum baccatum]|uniref:Uncharacterized protein n=1 Tax=Capsicum baccatum TaxID=33114 RepID=A0A2G2VXS7_CAPBA|nr:hypothetical protein CQW23_21316 [Capsicum baccatum]
MELWIINDKPRYMVRARIGTQVLDKQDWVLSFMNNIQVLDLSYNLELMYMLSSISNLESLRALLLQGCRRLKSMPSVGKFKKLRLLDVFHTGIKEVPQGIENLIKLKVLHMGGIDLYELLKEILPVTTRAGDLAVMGFLSGNHAHFHLI